MRRISSRLLDREVTLKRVTTTVNQFGEPTETETATEVRANVQPVNVEDVESVAGQVVDERRVVFLREEVTVVDRFSLDSGADFDVTDVRRWGHFSRALLVRAD